ncbi:MAG: acyl-CoA dehydrogenase family protein [Azonexus sp.]|jgi:alkylation response protein AidB-like acyl-CoA dehydrogenase|nr:acyl-CoA dehydrogenase family protein [Azonexus sp.]
MYLRENPEEIAFRTEVRNFVQCELPTDIRDRVLNFLRVEREDYVRWQRILHAKSWGAPAWPQAYGGTGWNATWRTIFEEECFTGGAPRQIPFGLSMCAPVLMAFGTDAQKARYLPRIISMADWWCQGYSEPGAGSDLAALKTRAERRGDYYVVSGQKTWTTYAHWANMMFLLARTDSEAKPQAGISFLLLDMKTPGVTVRPITTLDQGHDINEVFLDEVKVPVENLVGEENKGWAIAKYLLGHERTNIAGIGMCRRLMRRLKEIARSEQKRGRPLIEDPYFRQRITKLDMDLMCHEWSLMRLISLESGNKAIGPEASVLKIRGSEIQQHLTELLMECAGPYAVPFVPAALELDSTAATAGGKLLNPLAAQYFDMHKISIYGGANEIQKNIIAKAIIGL